MKKLLALAIAALSVCALQAITITWEFTGNTLYGSTGQNLASALYKGSLTDLTTSLSDIGTFSASTANQYIVTTNGGTFGALKDTTTANGVEVLMTNTRTGTDAASYSASATLSSITAGTYTIAIADTWWYNGGTSNDTAATPSYFKWIEFTITEDMAALLTEWDGILTVSGDGLLVLNDGSTQTTAITSGLSQSFVAPEPTVLALLALGVAGLALKRRA